MVQTKKIPVVLVINDNFVKPLSVFIISLSKNVNRDVKIEFNILTTTISLKNRNILSGMVNKYKNIRINFIDMTAYIKDIDFDKYMSRRDGYRYLPIDTYYRLYIPKIFSNYAKILYLDADMLLYDDIGQIYALSLDDHYTAAAIDSGILYVKDWRIKTRPELTHEAYVNMVLNKDLKHYFNAGVMLLNIEKMVKDDLMSKFFQFLVANNPLEYLDQDVMNAVIGNNIRIIDSSWNVPSSKLSSSSNIIPKVVHFTGADKPWKTKGKNIRRDPYKLDWWKLYALYSPYATIFDKIFYLKVVSSNKIQCCIITNIAKKLFSIKNSSDKRCEIVTILGFKLKIQKRGLENVRRFFFQQKITHSGTKCIKICKIQLPQFIVRQVWK